MTRVLRLVTLALPLVICLAWFHLFAPTLAWTTPIVDVVSGTLLVAALATTLAIWRGSARLSFVIGGGLLAAQAAIIACSVAGVRLVPYDLFPDRRLAIVVGIGLVLAVAGLVRQRMWARWLGLALGAVGMFSGGLNAVHYWSVTAAPNPIDLAWSMQMYLAAWVLFVSAFGGALVVINLMAPAARDACIAKAPHSTWTSSHTLVRSLRALVVASFVAVPMLLVYAWLQPIAPATRTSALVLAATLACGGILAIRGKVAGALLLVIAGGGLIAQTVLTAVYASDRSIAGYYAIFWAPAGILAIVCAFRLLATVSKR